jgi:DNA-binding transcriptional MerR regulator
MVMDKSTDAFRTIGEMAAQLGVKTHILRYWEEQFPMLQPLKRAGGRRHYRPGDVALLTTIHRLLGQEGYTIKGALKYLAGGGATPAPQMPTPQAATTVLPSGGIAPGVLRAIRNRLANALEIA